MNVSPFLFVCSSFAFYSASPLSFFFFFSFFSSISLFVTQSYILGPSSRLYPCPAPAPLQLCNVRLATVIIPSHHHHHQHQYPPSIKGKNSTEPCANPQPHTEPRSPACLSTSLPASVFLAPVDLLVPNLTTVPLYPPLGYFATSLLCYIASLLLCFSTPPTSGANLQVPSTSQEYNSPFR